MTARVACIHGINTSQDERLGFVVRWEALLRAGGLDVDCFAIPWTSHGLVGGDIAGLLAHERGVQWSGEVAAGLDQVAPHVVIAHSGGSLLMHGKGRQSAYGRGLVPIISIGSPLGHPISSAVLHMAGWRAAPAEVVDCWNPDDPITTSLTQGHKSPRGWRPVKVDRPGGGIEHADELYLRSPVVLAEIRAAIAHGVPRA